MFQCFHQYNWFFNLLIQVWSLSINPRGLSIVISKEWRLFPIEAFAKTLTLWDSRCTSKYNIGRLRNSFMENSEFFCCLVLQLLQLLQPVVSEGRLGQSLKAKIGVNTVLRVGTIFAALYLRWRSIVSIYIIWKSLQYPFNNQFL